jgi:hypothetical protein
VSFDACVIFRFDDEARIVSEEHYSDALTVLKQVGGYLPIWTTTSPAPPRPNEHALDYEEAAPGGAESSIVRRDRPAATASGPRQNVPAPELQIRLCRCSREGAGRAVPRSSTVQAGRCSAFTFCGAHSAPGSLALRSSTAVVLARWLKGETFQRRARGPGNMRQCPMLIGNFARQAQLRPHAPLYCFRAACAVRARMQR